MSGITLKLSEMAPQTWAEVHFSELNLDHEKRNQRAITLATAFATQPGKVFREKYRYRVLGGDIGQYVSQQILLLLRQKELVEVIEHNVQSDHIHLV